MKFDVIDLLKRYGVWTALAVALLVIALTPATIMTFSSAIAAVCVVIVMSSIAQWIYTPVEFTKLNSYATPYESIGKLVALGLLYLGTCIVVAGVYLGEYFIHWVPQGGQ